MNLIVTNFKEKIEDLESKGYALEAFLIQSAYIESLFRRFFKYKLRVHVKASGIRKAIHARSYQIRQILDFCMSSDWISSKHHGDVIKYFSERNSMVHDLVGIDQQSISDNLKTLLEKGYFIISNNKSIERFVEQAQSAKMDDDLVRAKEEVELNERESEIIEMRMRGATLDKIASKYGVTRERIRQIEVSARNKIEGLQKKSIFNYDIENKRKAKASIDADLFIDVMCKEYGITKDQLLGPSRKAQLAYVRHVIMYILKESYGLSYPAIGKKLGNRDHTTIIHGHQKIEKLLKNKSK